MAYESEIEKLRRRYDEKPEQWFAALADAHRKAGDLDQAVRIVEEGIKQRPNYVSGHIVLGRCLVDKGADDRAERVFEEVLELDAENIIALKVLGDVSERRGNREAARRWLGRLLEVDPMNDEARDMLDRVSQPEAQPAITPSNPDVAIVTQSAARTAGVASNRHTPQEGAEDAPDTEKRDSGKGFAIDSRTSVSDLLDAAARQEMPTEVAKTPEHEDTAPTQDDGSDDEGQSRFVIERAREALPSGEHDSLDMPPFATFSSSETKMVSFDEPSPSFDQSADDEDDAADLAAGTLDFVAPEPAEPEVAPELGKAVEDEVTASIDVEPDVEPTESSVDEPLEPPLELEVQPEPEVAEPLPAFDNVSEEDLPEDVASIFASAPPISQLSPDEVDEQEELASEPETVEEVAAPTAELAVPTSEVEDDFLADDIGPFAPVVSADVPKPSDDLTAMLDAAFDPVPADAEPVEEHEPPSVEEAQPVEEASETTVTSETTIDESVADVIVDEAIVGSIKAPKAPVPEPEPDTPFPLVTETMAEVYASQGHFDQAREVYRQLLADSPGDDGLQKRLAALEERAMKAATRGGSSSTKRYAASETGGVSVRSMLSSLLAGASASPDVASEEEVVFVTPSEPSPLEEAFGESMVATGEAAHPAKDGPSLASVFGEEADAPEESENGEPVRGSESPNMTYDGFYGSPERTPSPPEEPENEGDDDEEFKAWLQSLKS